jgi:hypothetical protein
MEPIIGGSWLMREGVAYACTMITGDSGWRDRLDGWGSSLQPFGESDGATGIVSGKASLRQACVCLTARARSGMAG